MCAVKDDPREMTQIHLLARGDYRSKGPKVGMRPIGVLLPEDTAEMPLESEKPRQKLADWITGPSNPLTPRAMVNRVCQYHFGHAIASPPNDFDPMAPPARPAARPLKKPRAKKTRGMPFSGSSTGAGWKPKKSAIRCSPFPDASILRPAAPASWQRLTPISSRT